MPLSTQNIMPASATVGANTVAATVNVGPGPHALAFDPYNNEIYVANYDQTVTVISGTSVAGTVNLEGVPQKLAFDPSDNEIYVTLSNNRTSIISGTTVVGTVNVGSIPIDLAFNPSDGYMYVANSGSNTVSVLSGTSVVGTVATGVPPSGPSIEMAIAFNPSNNYMYVANDNSSAITLVSGTSVVGNVIIGSLPVGALAFNPSNNEMYAVLESGLSLTGGVSAISGTTVVGTVDLTSRPVAIAFDPSNNYMYVAASTMTSVISGTTLVGTINVTAVRVAFDPADNRIYVANIDGADTVSVILGMTVVNTVTVGTQPYAFAFDSSNNAMYVANSVSNTVSVISNGGLIGRYWNNNYFPSSPPDQTTVDANISFATLYGYNWHPFGYGSFSVDWNGTITAPTDGTYSFQLNSDDGSWLYIDNILIINNGGAHGPRIIGGSAVLTQGPHSIVAQFFECCGGPSGVDLYWMPPGATSFTIVPSTAFCCPTGSFDFQLTASPESVTVLRGGSAVYPINLAVLSGTPQPVTLTVTGLPQLASFTPQMIFAGQNTFEVSTSVDGGLGDYNLTITGQAGQVSHSIVVELHVYDFTVTSSLCEQTVLRGSIAPFNLTLTLASGSSIVNLPPISIQVSGLPPDATIDPIVITLSQTPVTAQLLIKTGNVSLGDFPFSIKGVDGRIPEGGYRLVSNCQGGGQGFIAHVFQPIITYNCQPDLASGGSITCTFNIKLVFGSSNFTLPKITPGFINLPTGTFVICDPASATPPFTSVCTLTFPPGFTGGGQTSIGAFGSIAGGGAVRGTTPGGGTFLTLHIYDFQVIVSPQQTVLRGGAAVYNVTIALIVGSSTVNLPTIYLNVSGLPSGVTYMLSPTNGTAAGFTALLRIQTGSGTPLGDFSFNVTGTDTRPLLGGFRVGTGLLHLYDFTIKSSPSSSSATVGGIAVYNETLTLSTGSSTIGIPQIPLIANGLPTGTTTAFSPASVIPSLSGNSTMLTIQPLIPGTFSLNITGTDTRVPEGGSRSSLPQSPQTLVVLPQGSLTDTSYCPFDADSSLGGQQLRLIFTPNPKNPSTYQLTASNPGQFYYNAFFAGASSSTVMLTVEIPYPFITQGAVPIQVYSSVGFSGPCFIPTNNITPGFAITGGSTFTSSGAPQIGLADYHPQGFGSLVIVTVTGRIPSSGLVYVTIHLNYGLKGTVGYGKNSNNDALNATSVVILIPNLESYSFSQTGNSTGGIRLSATATVQSENVFKRDPGIAGLVLDLNGTPLLDVMVRIYDPGGHLVATVYTDKDGWYMWSYKYTGKQATFTIVLPGYNLQQSVTLKSNGFVVANFTVTN